MSILTYNDVILPYAHTTSFTQSAEYEESRTDRCYTKFDISLQAIVNSDYIYLLAPDLTAGGEATTKSPSDIMKVIRSRLLKQRKILSFKFNGYELIPTPTTNEGAVNQIPGSVDAKNGPQPQSCDIIELTNTTFLIKYHIIAYYWENNTVTPGANPTALNRPGNGVIYNRWTETVDIDRRIYTTSTRKGKYLIRSDNLEGNIADKYRAQMCLLGIPPGMIRQSTNFTVTPDGLGVEYNVVDKEVYRFPPEGIHEASGKYYETSVKNGALRHGEVHITLKGSPLTDQGSMAQLAVKIAAAKLIINGAFIVGEDPGGGGGTGFRLLEKMVVECDMYDNVVEVKMRARMKPAIKGAAGDPTKKWSVDFNRIAFTPTGTGALVNTAPPYFPLQGAAELMLEAAAYFDPSLRGVKVDPTTDQLNAGLQVGQAGKTKEP